MFKEVRSLKEKELVIVQYAMDSFIKTKMLQ